MIRGRAWIRAAVAAGAALLALGLVGAGAYAYAGKPHLDGFSPAAGAVTAVRTPTIHVDVAHAGRVDAFHVTIDGRDVSARVARDASGFRVRAPRLPDGRHSVVVDGRASGIFGGSLSGRWSFVTDTRPPRLRLAPLPQGYVLTHSLVVTGRAEPGARLSAVAGPGSASTRADASGRFSLPLQVSDGTLRLRVTARDRAGNERSRSRTVRVDATAPRVRFAIDRRVHTSLPVIAATVRDTSPVVTQAVLDGRHAVQLGHRPAQPLAEGMHSLVVTSRDAAGNMSERRARFLVDSTEKLGQATLVAGARGRDVADLQRRLHAQGFWHGAPTGRYTDATVAAVRRFQQANGIPVDGIAGPFTIGALSGHIVIDQSQHSLTLFRPGEAPVSFQVAVGQPAFPTPNGHFTIVNMVENPTWVPPPDAPWAQGALPIPPGPDNPLGTRWMGISAPGVGIHGTNDPASIGYSVSHGCIRMEVPDAEALFRMVSVGMPVTIEA